MTDLQIFYESSFYFTGFFICLSSLVYTFIQRRTGRRQNEIYICILITIMLGSVTSILNNFSEPRCAYSETARLVQRLANFFYFLFHSLLLPMIYVYIIYITGSILQYRRRKGFFSLIMIPFLMMEFMVLLNPFFHKLYTINENYVYQRGPWMPVFYMIAFLYFIFAIVDLVTHWEAVTPNCRAGALWLFGLTILGVAIQMMVSKLQIEVFAESMALMCVMLFIENEEGRMEVTSGLMNRNALFMDLGSLFKMKQPFSATVVFVTNADTLNKITGTVTAEALVDQVSDYLKTLMPYYRIYKTSPTCFALIGIGMSDEETEEMAGKIQERFSKVWALDDVEVRLGAIVMHAMYPKELANTEEVFLMTDLPIPTGEGGKVWGDGGLQRIRRSAQVEQALQRGFAMHNYEVYYQPVYFLENLSIHSAEALIRLHDNVLGDIPPTEFIPVAEHNGLIDRIDGFVLEEVCLFLSSGLPVEMGIEYISVNLSIIQCMRPGFAKYVKDMVLHYDVSPSLISFEIKESAASGDFSILEDMIAELRSYGFRFSMDSYGTGLSSMKALYSLEFDVIKIDRSILNRAGEGSVGRVVLESCVRMIRQMHRRILVEGVETKEQIDLLKKLDVDYVQGFYSSRPITKNELLGVLRATELAKMEERRAIAASEAKSSFLANMSHEIRTPINAVLGMNEMILRECDEDAVMHYAEEIETAGRNLLSLINNILDYSKIEAGEMEIVEAEYDLKLALGDVIREIYRKTELKHLSFKVYVSDELPARMYGDEFRLKQILTNLLNNAVKYTDEGSVHLTVEGEYYSENEVLLQISVEDTGCGIREEDQSKLYEMFQRLDMERNRTVEGTGLGLAISYQLLQMMQGEIEVESDYGLGSTFTVRLLQKSVGKERIRPFTEEELKAILRSGTGIRPFTAPDARILLVDDTALNHSVVRELLKNTKVQIESAFSGEEGLRIAKERFFDLLFLDQRMPGMDGTETLRELRKMEEAVSRRAPVISMTANAYPGIREEVKENGFEDYLEKPVNSTKLMELLLAYLPESKIFYT